MQIPSQQFYAALAGTQWGHVCALGLQVCAIFAWSNRQAYLMIAASLAALVGPTYQLCAPRIAALTDQVHQTDTAHKIARLQEQHLALVTAQYSRLVQEQSGVTTNDKLAWLQATEKLQGDLDQTRKALMGTYVNAVRYAPHRLDTAFQVGLIVVAFAVLQFSLLSAAERLRLQLRDWLINSSAAPSKTSLAANVPILCERQAAPGGNSTNTARALAVTSSRRSHGSLGKRASDLFERIKEQTVMPDPQGKS